LDPLIKSQLLHPQLHNILLGVAPTLVPNRDACVTIMILPPGIRGFVVHRGIVLFDLPKHCDLVIHARVEKAAGAVISDVVFEH
jgi:hypothetical protein